MNVSPKLDINELENRVGELSLRAGIDAEVWRRFMHEVSALKEHNEFMYAHSLRVGIYAYGIAAVEGQADLKFPLFAGCGHDVGKCSIENELLDDLDLPPDKVALIQAHSVEGYILLKDKYLFTGLVAGLHHKYRAGGYGIDLDSDVPVELKPESKQLIRDMAELIMIVDFFDALTTRRNNKGFIKDINNPVEQREVMQKFFPASAARIDWLIANRIL